MRAIFLLLLLFSELLFCKQGHSQKQYWNGKVITVSGKKYEKTRGEKDNNIVVNKPTADIPAMKPEKSAGALCGIYLYNYTGYSVDIYLDGEWSGSIAAYDSQYFYTSNWKAKIYGKSVGGNFNWGPEDIQCDSEYKWVYPE